MAVRLLLLLLAIAATPLIAAGPGVPDGSGAGEPSTKRRFRPPAVLLDGEPLAVLRFRELPPALPPVWKTLEDGRVVRRFSFVAWLRHVGVEPAELALASFHGGRNRVAHIEGRALADADLLFSFTQDTRGKLRLEWPARVVAGDTVDGVRAITLHRVRPPLEGDAHRDAVPGGLRVYLDGRLAGVARRAAVGEEGRGLPAILASLGISLEGVHAADLVFGDDATARVPARRLGRLRFLGKRGGGGQLVLDGSGRRASALLLHRRPAPALHDAPVPKRGRPHPAAVTTALHSRRGALALPAVSGPERPLQRESSSQP